MINRKLQAEVKLFVLERRARNFRKEMDRLDNLSIKEQTEKALERWKVVYGKLGRLEDRISNVKEFVEKLKKKPLFDTRKIFADVFGGLR